MAISEPLGQCHQAFIYNATQNFVMHSDFHDANRPCPVYHQLNLFVVVYIH